MKGMQITFKRMDAEEAVLYSKDKNHVWYAIYSIDLLYPNFSQFELYDLNVR